MITFSNRKSMIIRDNGRSADYITPSFGWGCLYNCAYCYMKRHKPEGVDIALNYETLLAKISDHIDGALMPKPNSTDDKYITYDISCNEDFALHAKHHKWEEIFDFFKNHPRAKATFATKYVNENFLTYNPEGKVRIRFSLMPEDTSRVLEPNTSTIPERIAAINKFIDAGYDVNLSFAPVVIEDNWLEKYRILFIQVRDSILDKSNISSEIIFLTHSEGRHEYNLKTNHPGESLIWRPDLQEKKTTKYGTSALRYDRFYKADRIEEFENLHKEILPFSTIRYIF